MRKELHKPALSNAVAWRFNRGTLRRVLRVSGTAFWALRGGVHNRVETPPNAAPTHSPTHT
eukprot:3946027-Prorocentrum_lima.AAC.1